MGSCVKGHVCLFVLGYKVALQESCQFCNSPILKCFLWCYGVCLVNSLIRIHDSAQVHRMKREKWID